MTALNAAVSIAPS